MDGSYCKRRALLTTAVDAIAMFPPVAVAHSPSGISVIVQPRSGLLVVHPVGAVIVVIVVVPVMWTTGVIGAIVVADAIAVPISIFWIPCEVNAAFTDELASISSRSTVGVAFELLTSNATFPATLVVMVVPVAVGEIAESLDVVVFTTDPT